MRKKYAGKQQSVIMSPPGGRDIEGKSGADGKQKGNEEEVRWKSRSKDEEKINRDVTDHEMEAGEAEGRMEKRNGKNGNEGDKLRESGD